jgi:glycosyltransferase involved in cell wall biosynthesis
MNRPGTSAARHILLFEPRVEGHHLSWLQYVIEDLLAGGFRVTIAIDQSPAPWERIQKQLGDFLSRVDVMSIRDSSGNHRGKTKLESLRLCFRECQADEVFLITFDEIASSLLRRAAFGWMPPKELRGRLGGIYHRPRFLAEHSLNQRWKRLGFGRLLRGGWFSRLVFLDEYLYAEKKREIPDVPLFFLPTPCLNQFPFSVAEARQRLGISLDRRVLLSYGGAYRRKGLHLVVEALETSPTRAPLHLLSVGQHPKDVDVMTWLKQLAASGDATILDRYVSTEEEELCFCAADVVLLPYIHHFGSSGVLAQAATAGKMMLASDEQLIGRRVREHGLGPLFRTNDVSDLRRALLEIRQMDAKAMADFSNAAKRYAAECTRARYRELLLQSFGAPHER